jgi:flap endonuclease-1
MGIQHLSKIIKEKAPQSYLDLPLSYFVGHRITIDAMNWIYINLAVSTKDAACEAANITEEIPDHLIMQNFAKRAQNFVERFLRNYITPIFVFEGRSPPEKKGTLEKRKKVRDNLTDKIEQQKKIIELLGPEANTADLINYHKLICRCIKPTSQHIDFLENFLRILGIPMIQGQCEGEKMASLLVKYGYAAAVFSTDTDCLTYGTPFLVTSFSQSRILDGRLTEYFRIIHLETILFGLEMNHRQFVDFCIMCGCDYNSNIPGIGEKRSYALINKYGDIDSIPETYKKEILNHVRCRELFATMDPLILLGKKDPSILESYRLHDQLELNKPNEKGKEFLSSYHLEEWISVVVKYHEYFALLSRPRLILVVD